MFFLPQATASLLVIFLAVDGAAVLVVFALAVDIAALAVVELTSVMMPNASEDAAAMATSFLVLLTRGLQGYGGRESGRSLRRGEEERNVPVH
jgi:hypothetical protein